MVSCRVSDCPNPAVHSSLCEEHYAEWRSVVDRHKTAKGMKAELEKKYDLQREPEVKTLGEF